MLLKRLQIADFHFENVFVSLYFLFFLFCGRCLLLPANNRLFVSKIIIKNYCTLMITVWIDLGTYPRFPETRYPARASRQSEILTRSSKTQVLPPSLYRTNYVQYHYLLFHRAFAKNYWVSSLFFPSLSLLIPYIAFLYFVLSNYHVQCTVIKEHEKGRESTQTFKYPDLEAGLEILPSLSKVPRSILIQCTT